MSDSYLDNIPSIDRERIRKRMRSPEAYEALREKVKGPEDLDREMKKNEQLAELHFALESEPAMKDKLKQQIECDAKEQGIDRLLEHADISPDARKALETGRFQIAVESNKETHHDQLMVIPEGKVQEKLPLKPAFSERYVGQLVLGEDLSIVEVLIDGKFCSIVALSPTASKDDAVAHARRDRAVHRILKKKHVASVEYVAGSSLNFFTVG